ncbi:MAG: beta-lactamase family protein, partial [Clostridiales Family XIII bacterium]|nr:beta-lactamase family protein [Clostridiales Family XIII bacterium]
MSRGQKSMEAHRGAIEQAVDEVYAYHDLPGLAVGVKIGENSPLPAAGLDLSSVRGYADFEDKIPLDADAVFHMASVAKLFVAEGVAQLRDAGRLRTEDRLIDHLPWFRLDDPRHRAITVGQVLSHTAGFPDIGDYRWTEPEADRDALRRFVASSDVTAPPLLWAPGSGAFRYSNIGYDILGALIAEVSGMAFETYMRERIFSKLGMRDSTFLTFLRTPEGRAFAGRTMNGAVCANGARSRDAEQLRAALDPRNLLRHGAVMPHRKDANRRIVPQTYYPYNRAHAPSSTLTSTLRDIKKWGDARIAAWGETSRRERARIPNSD